MKQYILNIYYNKKLIKRWDTRTWYRRHTLRYISINSTHCCTNSSSPWQV